MEKTIRQPLTFSLRRTADERGDTEEAASTGTLVITANGRVMTQGTDTHEMESREGPDIAGYYLAEWLVWNWWRLRWEPEAPARAGTGLPRSMTPERSRGWEFAHSLSTIGHGYDWPNIVISSDGCRAALTCTPSVEPHAVSYLYVREATEVVGGHDLERAIDTFVDDVFELLGQAELNESNLHALWNDLNEERNDAETARFRRLEALLGFEPDEVEDDVIHSHLADAATVGENALDEIAAHASQRGLGLHMPRAACLLEVAEREGFRTKPKDAVRLDPKAKEEMPTWGKDPAWKIGMNAAQQLRRQEKLALDPITNKRLADLAGTQVNAIANTEKYFEEFSFVMGSNAKESHVALRPKWETGRRFDLARLIGDRLFPTEESLRPATRAYSYRQKVQRAFAAHFLSPQNAVMDMLGDDDPEERQHDIANHFQVSEFTIGNLMDSHGPAW